jgi:hypothetical protein
MVGQTKVPAEDQRLNPAITLNRETQNLLFLANTCPEIGVSSRRRKEFNSPPLFF